MKVVVTSTNPVKKYAVLHAFRSLFPGRTIAIEEIEVSSGISAQPMTEEETLKGAVQRVKNAVKKIRGADYWIGIEGGLEFTRQGLECFAWIYILSKNGQEGKGRTGTFFLPKSVAKLIKAGKDLSETDNIIFQRTNSGQKDGIISPLTRGAINRTKYYEEAVIFALIPFINRKLYQEV